jgi:hypothetical protein
LEAAAWGSMDVHRLPNAAAAAAAGLGDLFPHEPAMVSFFPPFPLPLSCSPRTLLCIAWPRNRALGCGCLLPWEERTREGFSSWFFNAFLGVRLCKDYWGFRRRQAKNYGV